MNQTSVNEFVAEVIVLPDGVDIETADWSSLTDFAVRVQWKGPRQDNGSGGYAVSYRNGFYQLSRAGKWYSMVERFRRHQYRFDTLDEALVAARAVVNDVRIQNMTWHEWQEHWAKRQV